MINKIHPGIILPLGFALILVLMLAVTGYAVSRLNSLTVEAERLEDVTNEKIKLTLEMRELILLRSQTLSHVMIVDDYFARDEESQRFHSLAVDFIKKREQLIDLLKKDGSGGTGTTGGATGTEGEGTGTDGQKKPDQECKRIFSGAVNYCPYDGTKLQ